MAIALAPGPFELRLPLGSRVDALADRLMTPPGMPIDFAVPAGEPALVPADSVSWRVFKNPVTLFIGGVAAVLLELAEPRVRDGVWQHSSFRSDALLRLQRTGMAAMLTVYGPRQRTEAMIRGVVRAHGRVTGTTSEGAAYEANDPDLLRWVQATATFGFLTAYSRFASPLSGREMDQGIAEAVQSGELYGATALPTSVETLQALFARMDGSLVASPVIGEFLEIMAKVKAMPAPLRPLQGMLLKAAVSLLPDHLQQRLGLQSNWRLRRWEARLVQAAARACDRIVLTQAPPAQACRRLGLPPDWLYRR